MSETLLDEIEIYTRHGLITDPGAYTREFDALPQDPIDMVGWVQGLLIHIFWAEHHGLELSKIRQQEVNLRKVERQIGRALELCSLPINQPRELEQRLVGNCRDFSTLMTSALRHIGIPARCRCGFATYFLPGKCEDHWVCEYWNPNQERWIMVDSQLDTMQQSALKIDFDPLDVPHDRFLTGGQAWQLCRTGQADPEDFGIFDMHGLWFVRGDLIRDFLSLNRLEILPWDHWGLMSKEDQQVNLSELALLDHIAEISIPGQEVVQEILRLYQQEHSLRPPSDWRP
jgi:hypothetical protein